MYSVFRYISIGSTISHNNGLCSHTVLRCPIGEPDDVCPCNNLVGCNCSEAWLHELWSN